jgi:hypothetical protein
MMTKEKVKVVRFSMLSLSNVVYYVLLTEIHSTIDTMIDNLLEDAEIGDKLLISIEEMSAEEFANLDEFMGW